MGVCELCGKNTENLCRIKVAQSEMKACSSCKSMGKEVRSRTNNQVLNYKFNKRKRESISYEIVENYSSLLNKALSRKGIVLKQLARAINIKESTLNKYFTGKIKPDNIISRKLENYLDISLLQEAVETRVENYLVDENEDEDIDQAGMSLGDLLKVQLEKQNKK